MNYVEAEEYINTKFIPTIRSIFIDEYPDTFIKSKTEDIEIYNSSNGNMYSWYMLIINSLYKLSIPVKYSEYYGTNDYTWVIMMYNDLEKSNNKMKWFIENLSA